MNKAIIDANVLLALIDERDKWHSKAKAIIQILEDRGLEIIYLDCVINEVISVLGRRLEERNRLQDFVEIAEKIEDLIPKKEIVWIYPEVPHLYIEIMKLVKEKQGKLNFHDVLILLFSKKHKLGYLVSFDVDFDGIEWIRRISDKTEGVYNAQKT